MNLLRKLGLGFDQFNTVLVLVAAAMILFLVVSVCYVVVTRYVFGFTTKGLFQTWEYILVYLPFLGGAWLLKKEGHVKIDVVLRYLRPKAQALVNFVTSILGAITFLIITWYSAQATWRSYELGMSRLGEITVPLYLILMVVPVGSVLLFIQFLRRTHRFFGEWGALLT